MKNILHEQNKYVVRLESGEEIIQGLQKFCEKENIHAAFFKGIGSAENITLAYYSLDKKQYEDHEVSGRWEIVSLIGNVTLMNDAHVIHAHAVFSNDQLETKGGHVKQASVSATCEIFLEVLEGKMKRVHDDVTGLNLLA